MFVFLPYHWLTAFFPFDSRTELHQRRRIHLVVFYAEIKRLQLRKILGKANDKFFKSIHGRDVMGFDDAPIGEVSGPMLSAEVGDFAFGGLRVFESDYERHLFDLG